LLAEPYMEAISRTKGIDQKTVGPHQEAVSIARGRQQLLVGIIQPKNAAPLIPSRPTCNEMTMTPDQLRSPTGSMVGGGNRVRASYPNFSAALTTVGGLLSSCNVGRRAKKLEGRTDEFWADFSRDTAGAPTKLSGAGPRAAARLILHGYLSSATL
jgi:hypothetical protein